MSQNAAVATLIQSYQGVDPTKHSFEGNFKKVPKRTKWQYYRDICLHYITLGLLSKNPKLDETTKKLIASSSVLLESKPASPPTPEEASELLRVLQLHLKIVQLDQGRDSDKLQKIIRKAAEIKPAPVKKAPRIVDVPAPKQHPKEPAHAIIALLDACRKGNFSDCQLPDLTHTPLATWKKAEELMIAVCPDWTMKDVEAIPQFIATTAQHQLQPGHFKTLSLLAAHFFTPEFMLLEKSTEPFLWKLFEKGESTFQAQVIAASLARSPLDPRLHTATKAAWQKAGEAPNPQILFQINSLATSLAPHPESLVAYCNGLAAAPQSPFMKEKLIVTLFSALVARSSYKALQSASDDALACFKTYDAQQALQALKNPEKKEEKRLLLHFVTCAFENDPLLSSDGARAFLILLTPKQLEQLPIEQMPAPLQPLLSLRQNRLPPPTLKDEEQKAAHALLISMNIELSDKIALLSALWKKPTSILVHNLIQDIVPTANAQELLLLPSELLKDHIGLVTKHATRLQLLKLMEQTHRDHAVEVWWNRLSTKFAALKRRNAPFTSISFDSSTSSEPCSDKESLSDSIVQMTELLSTGSYASKLSSLPALAARHTKVDIEEKEQETTVWQLFKTGSVPYQAKVIKTVVDACAAGNAAMADKIILLKDASHQAWRQAGETVEPAWFCSDQSTLISKFLHLSPKALHAFLKGVAAQLDRHPTRQKGLFSQFLLQLFQHPAHAPFIKKLLPQHLDKVAESQRIPLLEHLDPSHIQAAMQIWWPNPIWNRETLSRFPIEKVISSVRDPRQISAIAKALLSHQAGVLIREDNTQIQALLNSLEKNPEKAWLILRDIDVVALTEWQGGSENPRVRWPQCFQALDWYFPGPGHFDKALPIQQLSDAIKKAISEKHWSSVWKIFSDADHNMRCYFLSSIKHSENLSEHLLALALLDDASRENLFQDPDLITRSYFAILVDLVEALSRDPQLPSILRQKINAFSQNIIKKASSGCDLSSQYNNPTFSDVTLQLGQSKICAHKALLSLDPFFSSPSNISGNPEEAQLRLKRLYNKFTLRDLLSPQVQTLVRTEKISLAPLFNRAGSYSDFIIEDEGINQKGKDVKQILVHKFILSASLPYFQGLFHSGMKESRATHLQLKDFSHPLQLALFSYVYTGIKPEFADADSQKAFEEGWNFIHAT